MAKISNADALIEQGLRLYQGKQFSAAVDCLQQARALAPGDPVLLNVLGKSLNNLGQLEAAADAFREAIQQRKHFAEAHNNLGHVLRAQGKLSDAADAFRTAASVDPGFAKAHKNLATIYQLQGKTRRAISSLRRGLELAPDDPLAQANLADLLLQRGHHGEALATYRMAVRLKPDFVDALIGLGAILQQEEQLDEALESYRRAFELAPDNEAALYGLASVLELRGRYEEGLALARAAIETGDPGDDALVAYARLLRRVGNAREAIDLIEPVVAKRKGNRSTWPRLDFTLADLHDDVGEYDRAFFYYERANRGVETAFEPEKHVEGVSALVNYFTEATMARLPRGSNVAEQPVFIVGMPRSGTTLVEQILAAHPAVHAGGELRTVFFMARDMSQRLGTDTPYPDCLDQITAEHLDDLAREYLAGIGTLKEGIQRITDKLPANFINLPLIELIFPKARIIHCKRDRLDTCLSCYFQNFKSQSFSHRLEHIGVYYSQYARLMRHWKDVVRLPILDIQYETLVSSQEAESRRVMAFLELDWDPACLDFYRHDRIIKTTSYAQVRKPIYTTSIGRHRHYASHLAPLITSLEAS